MDRKRKARLTASLAVDDEETSPVPSLAPSDNTIPTMPEPPRRRARKGAAALTLAVLFLAATVIFTHFYHISLLHFPISVPQGGDVRNIVVSTQSDSQTPAKEQGHAMQQSDQQPKQETTPASNVASTGAQSTQRIAASPLATEKPAEQQAQQQQAMQAQPGQQQQAACQTAEPLPTTCPELSREVLQQYAVDNTVMITFAGFHMLQLYGLTWLNNVKKAGINYYMLAVADNKTAALAHALGACHCFMAIDNEVDDLHADFNWGSKSWVLHTWQKVIIVRRVHQLGFNVLHSDLDVIWFRNPLDYFLKQFTAPDYYVSMDPITTKNPPGDDGPEVDITCSHYMNTGVYFLRATPGGGSLIDKWFEIRKEEQAKGAHDQDGLYHYLNRVDKEVIDRERRMSHVVNQTTWLAQLPANAFQNSYSHCINKMHEVSGTKPFAVHLVWTYGNNYGKMHRARELKYFYDLPSYYTDGHFITVDLTPVQTPPDYNTWTDTLAMVRFHLKAMEQQLTEMWYAFALAHTTGRILILPKLTCHCIHNWFESPLCRLPGEPYTKFPMPCPADFVFDMKKLYEGLVIMGRLISVREYSFLENERTAADIKAAPLMVTAKEGIPDGRIENDVLVLGTKLTDVEVIQAIEHVHAKHHKRIHITNPKEMFREFVNPHIKRQFLEAMDNLALKWCCLTDDIMKADKTLPRDFQMFIKP